MCVISPEVHLIQRPKTTTALGKNILTILAWQDWLDGKSSICFGQLMRFSLLISTLCGCFDILNPIMDFPHRWKMVN